VDVENGEIVFRSLDQAEEGIDIPPAELAGTE
jgi:hypothetical protein